MSGSKDVPQQMNKSGNNPVAFAESDGQFLLDLAADSGLTRTLSPRSKLQLMIRSVRAGTENELKPVRGVNTFPQRCTLTATGSRHPCCLFLKLLPHPPLNHRYELGGRLMRPKNGPVTTATPRPRPLLIDPT